MVQGQAELLVRVENLRNDKGLIQACLTRSPAHFPDCKSDPAAVRAQAPAASRSLAFRNLPSGNYALSLFHDENSNGRLDKFTAIPREGFAFGNNPRIRFGPPSFQEASIAVAPGRNGQTVRLRYLL